LHHFFLFLSVEGIFFPQEAGQDKFVTSGFYRLEKKREKEFDLCTYVHYFIPRIKKIED